MSSVAVEGGILLIEDDERWIARPTRFLRPGAVRDALRVARAPGVAIPGAIFVLLVLACFVGPLVLGLPDPTTGNLHDYMLPLGSPHHLLGTNQLGNDMLSRLLYGGRVSLIVGVSSTGLGMVIGIPLGAAAAYYGRVVEAVIMRFFDALFAFPSLILALAIAAYLGPSQWHTVMALAFFGISGFGRLAHGQTVRVRGHDYIVGARASGVGSWKIIRGHILPNIAGPLLTYALFSVGVAMVAEAGLSFLGLGVPIPQPSWGNIISSGEAYLSAGPQLVIMPSIMLFIAVLSLNLLADGLRQQTGRDR